MKNVECNAKEMVVALVAKTILEPQNGVLTRFVTATKLRQPKKEACRKIFLKGHCYEHWDYCTKKSLG